MTNINIKIVSILTIANYSDNGDKEYTETETKNILMMLQE